MREWFKLGLTAQKHRLTEAKAMGINAVSMSERRLSDTEWLVVTDLSQAEYDYNTMLVQICLAAGIALSEVLFLWASPPCNSISPCGTVNDLRGSGYRIYSDPTWPPRDDGSKYAKIAQNHDFMTSRVTRAMIHAHTEHGVHIAAENPRGGMERQWFMNAPAWKAITEKQVVDYCAFRHPYKKPENIWVSEFGWSPTGITGDGRCGDKCESGSFRTDTGRFRHDKVLSGATGTGPTGSGIEQQKNAVPPMLLDEILSAVKSQRTDSKRTWVIDLFAGYGSLRAVAKAQGLNYLAVDMRDLMSAAKKAAKRPTATGKE